MEPRLLDLDSPLPTSEELPDSDDTPVDNENQNTIPNWLLAVLEQIWKRREDWFFGVDMGIYDREGQRRRAPAVIPDGFLSVGVQRHKREGRGRLSYVLQEEQEIPPLLALEFVSRTYGQEYGEKMEKYARLGVKYYVLYNPEYYRRDRRDPFEVYQLEPESRRYQRQPQEPFWIPEIGLGIGRAEGELGGIWREWLAWHDERGQPYPLPEQLIGQLQERLTQMELELALERREKLRLRERLQRLGVDLDNEGETAP
ncbi:MAG: Uma2 family endonuclease [Cyanobacteriota bacterium]|nr:Uma2 family endonuclease [Cyanobacteriota bacterium]